MAEIEHEGCRLHYNVGGDGPPVVWIQGVGVHGEAWRPQIDVIALRYHCLSFDNRGLARSQPMGRTPSVERMGADAIALMDAEGWTSAHLVGHSLGGLVAQHVALTARARVQSLSLICTFANGRTAAPLTPWMFWVGMRTRIGTRAMRRRAFLKLVMAPEVIAASDCDELAAQLAPRFGHDLADQPPIVERQLAAMRAYNAEPRLAELEGISTLVVSGAYDPIAPPAAGRALSAAIPAARYIEIANASHGLPIQFPDRLNPLLLEQFTRDEAPVTR